MTLLIVKDIDPFRALPENKRSVMLGRAIFGLCVSLLINWSLELIPFSLAIFINCHRLEERQSWAIRTATQHLETNMFKI